MPTNIHASAIIDPAAQIGNDCQIGPYCVIGANVQLGAGCRLHSHVVIDGHTCIGTDCQMFPFVSVGQVSQDRKYQGGVAYVRIGSGTILREYVTVHAATAGQSTVIGDQCLILAYSHVAHDCILGNRIIMSNSTNLAGHVIVEDAVVFGGMVGVHQFVHIGAMAMIGAMAKVGQDVAPFALVDGIPAIPRGINKVGMERNGFAADEIRAMTQSHRLLFRSNLTVTDAVEQMLAEYGHYETVQHLASFAVASRRGLARASAANAPADFEMPASFKEYSDD